MNFKNITIESSTFLSYSSIIITLEEYRLCSSCQKSIQKVNSFCKICDRKIIFNYPYIHWELKEKLFEFLNDINNQKTTGYLANHTNRYNNERDIRIFDMLPQGANSLHDSIKDIMPYSKRNHMFD